MEDLFHWLTHIFYVYLLIVHIKNQQFYYLPQRFNKKYSSQLAFLLISFLRPFEDIKY